MPKYDGRNSFDLAGFWGEVEAYRLRHKLDWSDIAAICGLHIRTIHHTKASQTVPTIHTLARLAVGLDLSIDKHIKVEDVQQAIDAA